MRLIIHEFGKIAVSGFPKFESADRGIFIATDRLATITTLRPVRRSRIFHETQNPESLAVALQYEEHLALPIDVIVERENEATMIHFARTRLTEIFGNISLMGEKKSKKKSAALHALLDADRAVVKFIRSYFDPDGSDHRV